MMTFTQATRRLAQRRSHDIASPASRPVDQPAPVRLPQDWTAPRTGGVQWVTTADGTLRAVAA